MKIISFSFPLSASTKRFETEHTLNIPHVCSGSFEHVGVDPSDSLVTQIRGVSACAVLYHWWLMLRCSFLLKVCESLTAVPDTGVDFSLYASSPDGRKRAAKFLVQRRNDY